MTEELLLSVLVPTYKQEDYIGECIQSIQRQKVNFNFEILVGDDCSPDRTPEVVKETIHSDNRAKLFCWNPNEGGLKNIDKLLMQAKGKYITILEGDDYWIDTSHLQESIDYLESDDKAIFTCANYSHLIDEELKILQTLRSKRIKTLKFWHLALGNFVQMGTLVYRRQYYDRVPVDFISLPLGDYPLTLSLLNRGRGVYLNHMAMAYRVHSGGIWSGQLANIQISKTLETLDALTKSPIFKNTNNTMLLLYSSFLKIRLRNSYEFSDLLNGLSYIILFILRSFYLRG
jgi:glycosyltransferase involved in cell wall biosynthesis